MVARLLKYSLFFALVFGLVWLGAIIWWQETHRAVSAEDVILWMGLVPVAAIGSFFLLRWAYRVATRPAAAAPAEPAATGSEGGQAAAFDAAERTYQLSVIATAFAGMAGDSAEAATAALASQDTEPKLDDAVRDADGFPVKTARATSIDVATIQAWLEQTQPDTAAMRDGDRERLQRSLALLDLALPPLFDTLSPLFPPTDPHAAPRQPAPRRLAIRRITADRLDPLAAAATDAYLAHRIANAGWGPIALDTLSMSVSTSLDIVQMLDRFVITAHRETTTDVMLLIGTDSALDEETLADWSRRERFHSGKHPSGQIPGEAAAAVALMMPTAVPQELQPVARLHRIAIGLRDKPADARGRIGSELLTTLCTQAIDAAELKPETCSVVITDATIGTSRHAEAASMMTALLPELDAVADRLNLGVAFGELGAAGLPALLAIAASHCSGQQKPVLVNGIADARLRFAMMLTPADTAPASG